MSFPTFPFGWAPTESAYDYDYWLYLSQAFQATAGGTTKTLTATINGSTSMSATVVRTRARSATISGSTSFSASIGRTRPLAASISGKTTFSASIHLLSLISAAISGSTAASAGLVRIRARSATINGSTSFGATITGGTTASSPLIAGGPKKIQIPQETRRIVFGTAQVAVTAYAPRLLLVLEPPRARIAFRSAAPSYGAAFKPEGAAVQTIYRAERNEQSTELDDEFGRLVEAAYLLTR